MRELLARAPREELTLAEFDRATAADLARIGPPGFWKLERQQSFAEPGDDSWAAFDRGDWAEALRLIAERQPDFLAYYRRAAARGDRYWRVRVVELPLTPYLHWELHVLRLRAVSGAAIRVVGPERIERFEHTGPLPEVFTVGSRAMYEVVYNEHGEPAGGRRFTDRDLIRRVQRLIQDLYDCGEELSAFFDREVARLGAPCGG
ncbi:MULTISPECIES: DUF6879 family protein [unclassified Crossiella]|uniref:DUF6879 family protein n=1 Tax=unclassified Crossiella TaxID=2620835 RepID=UPI001FFE5E29|nr:MULTISPECIES: DUF6879 family protein [unclassified Crossiella]MCK2239246.1 hypothetical protein [Crossiella sp. S99.2]MCK2251185.1 hypothetical protein [Crossiella sp. S99.1]